LSGKPVIHPFRALWEDRRFRPLRRAIQGFALKTHELLKKLDQNFSQHTRHFVLWSDCLFRKRNDKILLRKTCG
jgi:hypothetical protein